MQEDKLTLKVQDHLHVMIQFFYFSMCTEIYHPGLRIWNELLLLHVLQMS